ncbi:RICIN domain-containing protein [Hymenobacter sp. 15J16-1T3B]|uniref:RICIN domain-containing protein n=1 Tax=Hymenobacter sp. 15J16-1T3B TaxID=2886941 RepID=UPI001D1038EE|nr:RICIN domain-containing protein [Hymenobacter sp. 15J16-1T3B]MCC3160051.1 RICIN domain-containing protein [Hymenobacter sp. 15J16-1T3B]
MPNTLPHSRVLPTGGPGRCLLLLALLLFAGPSRVGAQAINARFFGVNYWYPGASLSPLQASLKEADLQWMRIGGNLYNNDWTSPSQYDAAIQYAKATGCEPIVQVPIQLTPAQLNSFITYFNTTKGYNITYWSIGNEADPADASTTTLNEPAAWSAGTYSFPATGGYTYASWVAQFKLLATQLKTTAPGSKLVGPDFRLFYPQVISDYYKKFLEDVGVQKVGAVPMLDYLSFHFYGDKTESELDARFDLLQGYIDAANATRTGLGIGSPALRLALMEVNAEAGSGSGQLKPWDFRAGQFVALMAKEVMKRSGLAVVPWSIYESNGSQGSTDFSLFNADGSRRSTLQHLALLSQHRRDNVMNGQQSGEADRVVVVAMRCSTGTAPGYTVMLMNLQASTSYTYRAALDNAYHGAEQVRIKLEGYPGATTQLNGTLAPRSTHVYNLDYQGKVLSQLVYAEGDAAPVEQQTFLAVDKLTGGYLRPLDGLSTNNIVQDTSPDLTLSSFRWLVQPAEPGYFYLLNQYTGRALRPTGSSAEYNLDGRPIGQVVLDATNRYESASQWQLQPSGDADYYWLKNRSSGKYLRPQSGSTADNAAIVQNVLDPSLSSFKWRLNAQGFVPAPVARGSLVTAAAAATGAAEAQVYPNPAQDVLNVTTGAEPAELTLRDLTGRACRRLSISRRGQLDLRGLPAGIYTLTVSTSGGQTHRRVVKQ